MKRPLPIIIIISIFLLSACSFPFPEQTSRPIIAPRSIPTVPPAYVPPAVVPVPAQTSSSTTNPPTEEKTVSSNDAETPASEGGDFSIFLIALEDKGVSGKQIGCEDSVVPVQQISKQTGEKNTKNLMTEAYNLLLGLKDRNYGESGFINILSESKLKLESITLNNSKAIVRLSGNLTSGGICDDPRIKAQLEETALQFPEITAVEIFINGKLLKNLQDLKGE